MNRMNKRKTPVGGPPIPLAGKPAEEIRQFFEEHGLVPALSEADFNAVCETISRSSSKKKRTLRQWETYLFSFYDDLHPLTGKRRRAGGVGYSGGDGFVILF
jgi:hypothetical protein